MIPLDKPDKWWRDCFEKARVVYSANSNVGQAETTITTFRNDVFEEHRKTCAEARLEKDQAIFTQKKKLIQELYNLIELLGYALDKKKSTGAFDLDDMKGAVKEHIGNIKRLNDLIYKISKMSEFSTRSVISGR